MIYTLKLAEEGVLTPPKWLPQNIMFEGMTGSVAYGCNTDTSDNDIIGFCIPPRDVVFPHLTGTIQGFGTQPEVFGQFMQHHVTSKNMNKEFDITIYNIVKFFQLVMENNPNMVDVLFLPRRCILHSTAISEHVRDNRNLFLHKGSFHKFRGYAASQMAKIRNKVNASNPKRAASIEKFGYDTKFAMHVVRLFFECEQIMLEHDLDLERNSKLLISIRNGDWTLERLERWVEEKDLQLEKIYVESSLQHSPDEGKIKNLLMQCLEMHYGSLKEVIRVEMPIESMIKDLKKVLERYDS